MSNSYHQYRQPNYHRYRYQQQGGHYQQPQYRRHQQQRRHAGHGAYGHGHGQYGQQHVSPYQHAYPPAPAHPYPCAANPTYDEVFMQHTGGIPAPPVRSVNKAETEERLMEEVWKKQISDEIKAGGFFDDFRQQCLREIEADVEFKHLQDRVRIRTERILESCGDDRNFDVNRRSKHEIRDTVARMLEETLARRVNDLIRNVVTYNRVEHDSWSTVHQITRRVIGLDKPPEPVKERSPSPVAPSPARLQVDEPEDIPPVVVSTEPEQKTEEPVEDVTSVKQEVEEVEVEQPVEVFGVKEEPAAAADSNVVIDDSEASVVQQSSANVEEVETEEEPKRDAKEPQYIEYTDDSGVTQTAMIVEVDEQDVSFDDDQAIYMDMDALEDDDDIPLAALKRAAAGVISRSFELSVDDVMAADEEEQEEKAATSQQDKKEEVTAEVKEEPDDDLEGYEFDVTVEHTSGAPDEYDFVSSIAPAYDVSPNTLDQDLHDPAEASVPLKKRGRKRRSGESIIHP